MRFIFRAVAAGLAMAATASLAPMQAQARDLTVAVQKLPDVLEPAMENSNVHLRVIYSMFETLVRTDYRDGGKLKPGLATSWGIESPRSIVFTLREGVKFHSGQEMTAEDIAWAFGPERLGTKAEGTGGGGAVVVKPFLGGIESVEVLDRYKVRIRMKNDDALILQRFANYPAQIGSAADFEEAGDWSEWAKKPVGTGPYKVEEFVFGERLTLERFDDYWGEHKGAADKVTFVVVPEIATRIAGLRSGQFDIVTDVPPDHIEEIEKAEGTGVVGGPILNIYGLVFDSTDNPLSDPRIRRALSLAIDREAIVESLYGGRTKITRGWQMDVFGEMYLSDREKPAYDPEKARALLEQAGYDGEEIVYRSQEGYYTHEGEVARVLAAMWKSVGLNVSLDMVENWDQIYKDDESRMIFNGSWTAYYPDPVGQFWRRFGPDGSWVQRGLYENSEKFVELGRILESNPDTDVRREVFGEMLAMFDENPHGAPLYALTQFYGVRDGVDFRPYPTQYMNLTTSELSFDE